MNDKQDTAEHSGSTDGSSSPGWFMCYAYRIHGDDELCIGSTSWPDDGEKPWQKIKRWNEEMDYRTHALVSWQRLDDVFEIDVEI